MAALFPDDIPDAAVYVKHFAAYLIGKPYRARARGPDAFDCWGLCTYVWARHFRLTDVPDVFIDPIDKRAVRERFARAVDDGSGTELVQAFEGCAVLMGRSRAPDHVGIYLAADGGGVLHSLEHVGVVFTKLGALKPNGLNVLGFYRPHGMQWPTSTSSAI